MTYRQRPARPIDMLRLLRAAGLAAGVALAALGASPSHGAKPAATAHAAPVKVAPKPAPFEFAVLGDTPFSTTEVPILRNVLAHIGDSRAAFVIHAGNFKSASESCRDDLITSRLDLLTGSQKPLIYIPGANDWADCERAHDGGYNPVERLDFLREHAFDEDVTLGQGPMEITRQSDMARFRQYHENVRWFYRGIVFVGLNVPGNNNNYRDAGGRNGEYEDRMVATRVWLQHALVYAEQKKVVGMVIIAQADPQFEAARGGGLRNLFRESRGPDGFKEFRNQLEKLANRFKSPILLIDSGKSMRISQPLRDARGNVLKHFTQVSTWGSPVAERWLRIGVDARTPQLFKVETAQLPTTAGPQREMPAPAMPAMPATPAPASPVVPVLPALPPPASAAPASPTPASSVTGLTPSARAATR